MIIVNSQSEYDEKVNAYKLSDASIEVRENAMNELSRLNPDYSKAEKKNGKLMKEILSCQADIDDIGGH